MNQNGTSLAEKVSQDILSYILDHGFKPGTKLPNEYELAQMLGVGRSSIREAVKLLASRNILEVRQGSGTFVSDKKGIPDDPLGFRLIDNKKKLAEDLLSIRILIEPQIASLAAIHATDEEIQDILRLCGEVEELIYLGKNYLKKDIEFHSRIAWGSKNVVAPNLLPIIQQAIEVFMDITDRKLKEETIRTHREIAEAISRRDSLAAHDAAYLHLVYNRRLITKETASMMNLDGFQSGK